MSKNNLISVHCFGIEIGRLGFDEQRNASFFQYSREYLQEGRYARIFPMLIRNIAHTQVFDKYAGETFRGLPPVFADSLPDVFGNLVFKAWLENSKGGPRQITVLEQLAYVGRRGMGALEYEPAKDVRGASTIDIEEMATIVSDVLQLKNKAVGAQLDTGALINIFRIGSSAGGVRPKILVAEHRSSGRIVPGDLGYADEFDHYLVKLHLDEETGYNREVLEFVYAKTATAAGITMMPSRLIDDRHFATLRFDRKDGRKLHTLTATGISGLDYRDPSVSSYENLFGLALHLKLPHRDMEELFRRMVFNLIFANHDDHLKNHSFIYDGSVDGWTLAPAYDLTYSLNPELAFTKVSRALSLNGKRSGITRSDVLKISERFTIRNARGIIAAIAETIPVWERLVQEYEVPERIRSSIRRAFQVL